MDIQDHLRRLPEPDPNGPDRLRARFRQTRARERRLRWALPVAGLALAAVATLAVLSWDRPRTVPLDASGTTEQLTWSDQVQLEFSGHGAVSGTARDVSVDWEQGRLAVQVAPNTGTQLEVHTDEGVVAVVGTAFTVTRDRLGVSVSVTHGKVSVACGDGWSGMLQSDDGDHTCLPLSAAGLLGRADALIDRDAAVDLLLHTLDLGLEQAEPGSAEEGELRVRRMHARTRADDRSGALADADAYLSGSSTGRHVEVRRFASRLALHDGCEAALPYLEPLADDGDAEDAVLLAECLDDPIRARALLEQAITALESTWLSRARNALRDLEGP